MLGRKTFTPKLFYQFSLEERVPADHLLRRAADAVDFAFVRRLTARFYSHTGQPGVDPVVLFKMALLGWLYGITSERLHGQHAGGGQRQPRLDGGPRARRPVGQRGRLSGGGLE